jgi:DNA-binding MarR family transcriptional regulator
VQVGGGGESESCVVDSHTPIQADGADIRQGIAQSRLFSLGWTVCTVGFTVGAMAEISEAVSESAVLAAREVRVVYSRLRRRLRETYDTGGLTPSQTSVLSRLDKEGPASTSELAAAERVRPQSMAATLGALDERGLIRRRPDPGDGRRHLVEMNEAGRALMDDKRRAGEEWLARSLQESLTEEERQTVIEALALLERLTHS